MTDRFGCGKRVSSIGKHRFADGRAVYKFDIIRSIYAAGYIYIYIYILDKFT